MRALLLALALVGCTSDKVSDDTNFRRLIDGYATYDACIDDQPLTICYQTLTLCPDGVALMDLDNRPDDGRYKLDGEMAYLTFRTRDVVFDLAKASSPQLPGQHPWEAIEPTVTGCAH